MIEPGLPRPRAFYEGNSARFRMAGSKPVPWIAEQDLERDHVEWTDFDPVRSLAAYECNLCQVCGEVLWWCQVLLATTKFRRETSGPPLHPACALVAVRHCPMFETMTGRIGWVYWGLGRGYLAPDWPEGEEFTMEPKIPSEAEPIDRSALRRLVRTRPFG